MYEVLLANYGIHNSVLPTIQSRTAAPILYELIIAHPQYTVECVRPHATYLQYKLKQSLTI